jgi:hypothetical protein
MNKRKRSEAEEEIEEEETEDERSGILRDGQRVRVSLFMRDGAINPNLTPTQRAKALAAQQTLVSDGSSNPMAMHKPGFRYLTDANRRAIGDAAKAKAYQEVEQADANAWKGATSRLNLRDQQEGDPCTVSGPDYPDDFGSPGTLQMGNDGELVCVPGNLDARRQDSRIDAREAAYRAYDEEMSVAWRK